MTIHIFLTAPADVTEERELAERIIARLARDSASSAIECVTWDTPDGFLTPDEADQRGLPPPSNCDVVILIVWQQMGPPLPDTFRKPDGRPYVSALEWVYQDALESSRRTGKPLIMVYRRILPAPLKLADPDFTPKDKQRRDVESFFASFYDEHGILNQNLSRYDTRRAFLENFEQNLKLQLRILAEASAMDDTEETITVRAPVWEGSPYPGLRPFAPDEGPIFFGREREIVELIHRLRDPHCRFLAITGASGTGKSSLINAGLLPQMMNDAIRGSKHWVYVRITPGEIDGNPFLALASRCAPLLEKPGWQQTINPADKLAEELHSNPDALSKITEAILASRRDTAELLIVVDQFEELFTIVKERYCEPFCHLLAYAVTIETVRLIITLDSDFYERCVARPQLAMLLKSGSFPLTAPNHVVLYDMITRPAARANLEFESVLDFRISQDADELPGGLALLAYTLRELYDASRSAEGRLLSHDVYDKLGGVSSAFTRRVQGVLNALDPEARNELPNLFQAMIAVDEAGAVSRYVPLDDITTTSARRQLADALLDAHILTRHRGKNNQPTIVLSQSIAFHAWPELIAWIKRCRDDLRQLREMKAAALAWHENNRQRAYLWPDAQLKPIHAIVDRLQPELTAIERDFIKLEFDQLLDEIADPATPHARRAEIGDRLAELGDARPGIGLQPDGLPDLVWCSVPAGTISLPDDGETHDVESFHIAKYPVTFAQFQAFIDAEDGYYSDQWWDDLAHRPEHPGTQEWPIANHPRENVSWYDAVAFCRWLSAKRRYPIRLPYEWEWQQAATGGNPANVYPWGSAWQVAYANTSESGVSRTTAVGLYPLGASPVGALDMCGNVWEWCRNEHRSVGNTGPSGYLRRVVRGGAWNFYHSFAQTTSSDWPDPTYRFNLLGFRVVAMQVE